MFTISEDTLREWWGELDEPARQALASDPQGPVPSEFVDQLMDLQGYVVLIPFRHLGNGAMSYLLPSRARAFVSETTLANGHPEPSRLLI